MAPMACLVLPTTVPPVVTSLSGPPSWHLVLGILLALAGTYADHATTVRALRAGARERNKLSAWVMERTGHVWPATLLLDTSLLGAGSYLLYKLYPAYASIFLCVAGAAQLWVARRNAALARRLER